MRRPRIIINCAMSADGKFALPNRKQIRISNNEDMKRVYELRNECDAIIVGIGSILSDDPKLTVNEKYVKNPKQPLRLILDSRCRTPKNALVLNNITKTIIFTLKGNEKQYGADHIDVIGINSDEEGLIDLEMVLNILDKMRIKKLLVEGGGNVIWSFLNNKFIDDLYVYIGPCIIGGKNTPTMADGIGIKREEELISLKIISVNRLGDGLLIHYNMV